MPKYGVFSGPYFPVFGLNAGKYGPEKTPYLDTFHAVIRSWNSSQIPKNQKAGPMRIYPLDTWIVIACI